MRPCLSSTLCPPLLLAGLCCVSLACAAGGDDELTGLGTFESGGVGSDGLSTTTESEESEVSSGDSSAEMTTSFETGDPTTSTTSDPSTTTTGDPTTGDPTTGDPTTGDPTTTGTGGGSGGCDMLASDVIDDFEDADGAILNVGGRQGFWYIFNDGSGGSQMPPNAAVLPVDGGACDSGLAMRTSGSGFSIWGAGIGVDLNNVGGAGAMKMPYDVSGYSGIVLAARGSGQVRASVQIAATIETTEGGTCAAECDPHGMNLNLTDQWQQFTLPFDQIAQEGWGTPVTWDPSTAMSLQFKVGPNETLDLWVDEIGFY